MAAPLDELIAAAAYVDVAAETSADTSVDISADTAAFLSAVAAESTRELAAGMAADWHQVTVAQARFVLRQAEFKRREGYLEDGATSLEAWTEQSFAMSAPTARTYCSVADKATELPELMGSLWAGTVSFDQVRTVVDVATPETDAQLCAQAKECTVRQLADVARTTAARARSGVVSPSRSEHEGRYVRFNDERRTMSCQLPSADYAKTKAQVDAAGRGMGAEDEGAKIPLDQRRYDALLAIMDAAGSGSASGSSGGGAPATSGDGAPATSGGAPSPFFVVAHVVLEDLVDTDEAGRPEELVGELEHGGLIDRETVRRIACDSTVVVAVDDSVGHTMYEGRARRFPSGAQRREVIRRDRTCRFPGCANFGFTDVHHIVPWEPGGATDLDNLVVLCRHHHGVVHRKGQRAWSMTGNPSGELTFVGPSGRVMVSRPSPLWARVSAGRRKAERGTAGESREPG